MLSLPACARLRRQILLLSATRGTKALTTFSSDDPKSCTLIADDDVYGIGLRTGLYLQWGAVLAATWCAPNEARYARTITNIVTIAVLANTLKETRGGSVVALEWWIVIFNNFLLQVGNIPLSRRLVAKATSSLGAMMLMWSVILFANCWVWFAGADLGRKEACDVKVFLFRPISIYSERARLGFRVLSVIGCVAGFVTALAGVAALSWNAILPRKGDEIEEDDESHAQGWLAATLSTALQVVVGCVAIVHTEMTIRANDITFAENLSSSGQTFPFAMGVITLTTTFAVGLRNFLTCHPLLPVQIPYIKRNFSVQLVQRTGLG